MKQFPASTLFLALGHVACAASSNPMAGLDGGQGGQSGQSGQGAGGDNGVAGNGMGSTGGSAGAGGGMQPQDAGPVVGGSDGGTGAGGANEGPVSIHFFGRWNLADSSRAITVNSGSHLGATFDGTGVTARFDVSLNVAGSIPTLAWKIDAGDWIEAEVAASVSLAAGLPAGRHAVLLMARSMDEHQNRWRDPLVSSLTFLGLDVTGGALAATLRPVRKKIEFLGDSITEGVLVQPVRPGKTTWAWQTDGRVAWAAQTAMQLGVEWRQVGFGAQGLTRGGSGGVPAAPGAFDFIYANVRRDTWQADLVVINQGTNDGGGTTAVVQASMAVLLMRVRTAYPGAHIAVMRPFNGSQATALRAAVDAHVATGDLNLSFLDTTGWLGNGDFTDGLHPNAQGCGKVRDRLVPVLMRLL